ncbi:MAG: D-glycero-beta-D-manno-heptose 1-phosphate adenylyltransferase [Deltaproteobacteria bacterium]|jgi:rfaE bifunctional protein nucleotidyltransferase chain/domain|nr:D-glycero-beta-D-manno-heptose 1-phosphate adenylyltransferase [Deltaproteobacteria bacterium]
MKIKLNSLKEALVKREQLAEAGGSLVFTNGCFDLLHPGHLSYLSQARALGDALFIGLNSDDSTKRLKGPKRPVNNEMDRAYMLSGLYMVDSVIIFPEDTPLTLIEALKPDVVVKGGDWTVDNIVGGRETIARGGKAVSLPFLPGFSTTELIYRIVEVYTTS